MKLSGYFAALAAAMTISFATSSCNDDLSAIGQTSRPETDGITIKFNTFDVDLASVYRDSVYVRTGYPLLGSITDPQYGELQAGFLAQFYANKETGLDVWNSNDSLTFSILRTSAPADLGLDPKGIYQSWDSIIGNRLDSMTIRIYYQSYYGDSLSPMQLSIYSLNPGIDFADQPESEFYSNNDFRDLYTPDAAHLLGSKGYTAANRELSDSIRNLKDYMPYVEVKLSDEKKNEFYRLCVEAALARDNSKPGDPYYGVYKDIFTEADALRNSWLSGVCVKPTFGDGSLVKVYYTAIYFFYSSYHRYAEDGTILRNAADDGDSTYVANHVKYVAVTPDVIQMSGIKFLDSEKDSRLASPDSAFISSPQGYYTTLDLPVGKMITSILSDESRRDSSYFLNAANFYLKAYKPHGSLLSNTPPPTVLMVRNDSVNTFFEEGMLPSSRTSCYATYVCDSIPNANYADPTQGVYYYSFGNIAPVIMGIAESTGWDKSSGEPIDPNLTVKMAIIPVDVTTSSQGALLSVSNYVLPTAVRLRKGTGQQKIQMIYTLEGTN